MFKKIFSIAIIAGTIILASCGGNKEENSSKEDSEETVVLEEKELTIGISQEKRGDFAENITLKEDTITIKFAPGKYNKNKYEAEVIITATVHPLKALKNPDMRISGSSEYYLEFLDEKNHPIGEKLSLYDKYNFEKLFEKTGNNKADMKFSSSHLDPEKVEKIIKETRSVRLVANGETYNADSGSSSSSDDDSDVSSSTSSSYDDDSNDGEEKESNWKKTKELYKSAKGKLKEKKDAWMEDHEDEIEDLKEKGRNAKEKVSKKVGGWLDKMRDKLED